MRLNKKQAFNQVDLEIVDLFSRLMMLRLSDQKKKYNSSIKNEVFGKLGEQVVEKAFKESREWLVKEEYELNIARNKRVGPDLIVERVDENLETIKRYKVYIKSQDIKEKSNNQDSWVVFEREWEQITEQDMIILVDIDKERRFGEIRWIIRKSQVSKLEPALHIKKMAIYNRNIKENK